MKLPALLLPAFLFCFPPILCAQAADHFAAYQNCRFTDDLALVETTPLAAGIAGRTVKTIMGDRNVPLAAGTRLMYAYPHTGFFANVKVEQIPADGYTQAKQDLIANWEQILTGDDSSSRNYALKPRLNGLEIYGLDRKKLEGNVLGIYLFFVDRTHTVTTIYFLNQDSELRKFDNLDDYARLRDAFIESFTACAAGHVRTNTMEAAKPPAKPLPAMPSTGTLASEIATPAAAATLPDAPQPSGTAAVTPVTPYVPPEAAPLVHPQTAPAAKKAAVNSRPHSPAKKAGPAANKKVTAKKKKATATSD